MKTIRMTMIVAFVAIFGLAASARAETTVTLNNVHICCGACVKAVGTATKGVEGATVTADRKGGTVTIKAGDDATAQKAVDALAAAGFHGASSNDKIGIKDDSGAKKGAVKRLVVSGAHNCCPACCKAIKKVVGGVDGVEAETVKPRAKSFVVEGEFDAAALVKALNKAGFHVKVKQ